MAELGVVVAFGAVAGWAFIAADNAAVAVAGVGAATAPNGLDTLPNGLALVVEATAGETDGALAGADAEGALGAPETDADGADVPGLDAAGPPSSPVAPASEPMPEGADEAVTPELGEVFAPLPQMGIIP